MFCKLLTNKAQSAIRAVLETAQEHAEGRDCFNDSLLSTSPPQTAFLSSASNSELNLPISLPTSVSKNILLRVQRRHPQSWLWAGVSSDGQTYNIKPRHGLSKLQQLGSPRPISSNTVVSEMRRLR